MHKKNTYVTMNSHIIFDAPCIEVICTDLSLRFNHFQLFTGSMGYSIISVYICVRLQLKWHVVYKYKEQNWSQHGALCRVRTTGHKCRQMRRKNIFGTKKIHLAKTSGKKKILLPKNRHLNITDLGCFMPLNLQLTSWITCLKAVADQLIHYDNTFR